MTTIPSQKEVEEKENTKLFEHFGATNNKTKNDILLAWKNLSYSVNTSNFIVSKFATASKSFPLCLKRKKKTILNRLSGHCRAGTLTALMGPSGSGKTTLLNILSGNKSIGLSRESEIYIQKSSTRIVANVVEQNATEFMHHRLTVGEILGYAYRFRQNNNNNNADDDDDVSRDNRYSIDERIRRIIRQLMLPDDIIDVRFDRCSGGEKRRVAIGQELIRVDCPRTNVEQFLFVDEPTSGLDSASALIVAKCLANLCHDHGSSAITIIASIHAPSTEVLGNFDHLYVLSSDGNAIYSDSPPKIDIYLEHNFALIIDRKKSIKYSSQPKIETLIEIANDSPTIIDAKLPQKCRSIENAVIDRFVATRSGTPIPNGICVRRKRFSFKHLCIQLERQFRITFVSNFHLFFAQLLLYLVNVSFLSTLYTNDMALPSGCVTFALNSSSSSSSSFDDFVIGKNQISPDHESLNNICKQHHAVQALLNENISFHVFCGAIMGFVVVCCSSLLFSTSIAVFAHEYQNRWYSLGTFFIATTVTTALEVVAYATTIATTAYLTTEQHSANFYEINFQRAGHYIASVWLLCLFAQSLGQLIGSVVSGGDRAGDGSNQNAVIAVVASTMTYMCSDITNDFLFQTDDQRFNSTIRVIANIIGLKYVTKYMIIALYGINRCESNQFSIVLRSYYVDPDDLSFYVARLITNILVMRMLTSLTIYTKFNFTKFWFYFFRNAKNYSQNKKPENARIDDDEICGKFEKIEAIEMLQNTNINQEEEEKTEEEKEKNICVAWQNLTVHETLPWLKKCVDRIRFGRSRKPKRPILTDLSGQLCFGTIAALMGSSGAGKTSLLNVINGRQCNKSSGRFFVNARQRIETCFLTQDIAGHLAPGLTVRQTLLYACRLKNLSLDETNNQSIVHDVIEKLDLGTVIHTRVERCSGGERKRIALAAELTARDGRSPNLICIDEPTSGLDSNSAQIVMDCLARLASTCRLAIVASIHQPSSCILSRFDQLYVLSRGGVCIFAGPPKSIAVTLAKIYLLLESKYDNDRYSIEQLIDCSCLESDDPIVVRLSNQVKSIYSATTENMKPLSSLRFRNNRKFSLFSAYHLASRNFAFLLYRQWKEWLVFYVILLCYAHMLLVFWPQSIAQTSGCIDTNRSFPIVCDPRHDESIARDNALDQSLKFDFFMANIFLLLILLHSCLCLHREMMYIENEHRNGWYSVSSFYLAKTVTEIVPLLPFLPVYIFVFYRQVRPGIYWHFLPLLALSTFASQGMAHTIVLLSKGHISAITAMFMFVYELFLLLSNFFVAIRRLNVIYRAISRFSISRFTFENVLLLIYGFDRCDRGAGEVHLALQWIAIDDDNYWSNYAWLVADVVTFRLTTIVLLFFKFNRGYWW